MLTDVVLPGLDGRFAALHLDRRPAVDHHSINSAPTVAKPNGKINLVSLALPAEREP